MTEYRWATDAASGTVSADSARAALDVLIAEGEWAALDSPREAREISDGAWLMLGEEMAGDRLIVRGTVP